MDSLLFWGFVLLAIIIVTPFIAYTALRRTAELKDKVSDLTAETEELRRALKRYLAGEQAPETETEIVAVRAKPAPAPYSMQAATEKALPFATPVSVATPAPAAIPAPVTITKTAEPVNRPPVYDGNRGDIQEQNNPAATIIQWLLNGNVLAKVGILLLFVGLSYLLKFSIENNMLTPEFRLIGAGTLSVVLFIAAWRVRDKNRLYSLIVQGGSLGAFYITIFAAYKLYQFLPPVFALLLMVIICMASVFFAVVQRAVSLAVLAVIGGYAAPVLLSTGSGNYIALFSYYLMLSVSILVMNHWQGWRLLNIIGFAFTFVIGVLWGVNNYQPEYYLSCQIFIILNLILYGLMTQQYARLHMQTDGDRKQLTVDSVLLFAPPILAFSLQYAITLPFYLGTAISSLSFGLIYMVLTVISLRRFREPGHRLSLGFLLLSTGFISLAVPLALSAQWTSVVWTIEGLAILWFACL